MSLLGTFTLLEVVGWVCDPLVCMAVKCLYFGFLWKISHLSTCLLYLKYYVLFPILKKLVYSGGIQYHLSNGMQIQLLKSTGLWRRYECVCVCVNMHIYSFWWETILVLYKKKGNLCTRKMLEKTMSLFNFYIEHFMVGMFVARCGIMDEPNNSFMLTDILGGSINIF